MPRHSLTLEAECQKVLDELWNEKQIPFALKVGKITRALGEFTIHFYDSRMPTASITLTKGQSFRDMVRSATLARVAEMNRQLND